MVVAATLPELSEWTLLTIKSSFALKEKKAYQ